MSTMPDRRKRESVGRSSGSRAGHGVPRLPRVYVPRIRLWDELDRVSGAAITLVVAPVGAGKTLGLAGWPRVSEADTRWILGGPEWTAAALAEVLDEQATSGPGGTPGLIVIDDAHLLPPATIKLLERRLDEVPDTLRLVLMSRWDLAFGRLVPELLGHVATVRGQLLEMTEQESTELVTAHARTDDPSVIKAIVRHAHGWCAAVVLTARAVAASPSPQAAARLYADGSASVADRLATEVFSALKPQERHLLLCVAAEGIVTTDLAEDLSRDSRAAEVLERLEATGLFVTRVPDERQVQRRAATAAEHVASTRYRIHPLMVEIVRRRLAAGGVDVARAQSTVSRAVRLHVHRGDSSGAFGRLVAAHCHLEAAALVAEVGPELLLRAGIPGLHTFVRRHPDVVDAEPGMWFTLALDRWLAGDTDGAGHWLDRAVTHLAGSGHEPGAGPAEPARLACLHLVRARLGAEPLGPAIEAGRTALRESQANPLPEPVLPLLALELGIAECWFGDHAAAEVSLGTAADLGRARGLGWLTAEALSHLALALFFQGREHAALTVAEDAHDVIDPADRNAAFPRARAATVRRLAVLAAGPHQHTAAGEDDQGAVPEPPSVHRRDGLTRFAATLADSRYAVARGDLYQAEHLLQAPELTSTLPRHLRLVLHLERGLLAALAGDTSALRAATDAIVALDSEPEAKLLTGLRLELEGDTRRALESYVAAAEPAHLQPATHALALACQAQLLDLFGSRTEALARLREAVTCTEVRRNAVPFLGWSRLGTPMETLLAALVRVSPSPWLLEVADARRGRPDIATAFVTVTASAQERESTTDDTTRPNLTTREREVLNGLARGATYADIAAHLFVSENTVKSHVSSLYGKLTVNRRSEALAVARSLHLI